jgi:hypothetical protein
VHFPPQKAWDPEAKWNCVMIQEYGEKHSLARCKVFKELAP